MTSNGDNVIVTTSLLTGNQVASISGGTRYITVSSHGTPVKQSASTQNVILTTQSPHGSPVILQSPSRGGTAQVFHTYTSLANATPILKREREADESCIEMKRAKLSTPTLRGNATNTTGGSRGLRHFSMKVCEQVQKRGKTSYNEVADELVNEFSERGSGSGSAGGQASNNAGYDQRNIRRRVYDALNVLMAMGIIEKKHKEIHWLGLPTNSAQECKKLEIEKRDRLTRISSKTQQLYDTLLQHIAYKNLVERNKGQAVVVPVPPNSTIDLPFIIINSSKETSIDCQIANDKREYLFNFDNSFEIHDDIEVLKRMGLAMGLDRGEATPENILQAKSMLPKALQPFVEQMAKSRDQLPPDMMRLTKASLNSTDETVLSILPSPSSEENYSEDDQYEN